MFLAGLAVFTAASLAGVLPKSCTTTTPGHGPSVAGTATYTGICLYAVRIIRSVTCGSGPADPGFHG